MESSTKWLMACFMWSVLACATYSRSSALNKQTTIHRVSQRCAKAPKSYAPKKCSFWLQSRPWRTRRGAFVLLLWTGILCGMVGCDSEINCLFPVSEKKDLGIPYMMVIRMSSYAICGCGCTTKKKYGIVMTVEWKVVESILKTLCN